MACWSPPRRGQPFRHLLGVRRSEAAVRGTSEKRTQKESSASSSLLPSDSFPPGHEMAARWPPLSTGGARSASAVAFAVDVLRPAGRQGRETAARKVGTFR